jgi:hypothetical protein
VHAHDQKLVLVVKMATILVECTTEEQNSVMRFLWTKRLKAKDIHKKKVSCLWWEVFVA